MAQKQQEIKVSENSLVEKQELKENKSSNGLYENIVDVESDWDAVVF